VLVGVFLLPRLGCAKLTRWTVWKASHVGVLAVDMVADVYLDSLALADNHIGVWPGIYWGCCCCPCPGPPP
jgi:hypothetical protein